MATDAAQLRPIRPEPAFESILRDEIIYSSGRDDGAGERINGWFDKLMVQSGLEMSPVTLLMLSLLAALTLGGIVFVINEDFLSTAFTAVVGAMIPVGIAVWMRSRRQRQILDQMPGMIGELARAARTGRSLDQCFQLVAEDTLAPLGDELRRCSRRMQMGVSLPEAIEPLPERTGVVSLSVLSTALSVHQQTGGDLVSVLERLQHTIRDRITFLGRLRTATSASRATAIMMLLLPIGILTFFIVRDPQYFSNLMESAWGKWTTIIAITLQVIGSIWVLRILRRSQRT